MNYPNHYIYQQKKNSGILLPKNLYTNNKFLISERTPYDPTFKNIPYHYNKYIQSLQQNQLQESLAIYDKKQNQVFQQQQQQQQNSETKDGILNLGVKVGDFFKSIWNKFQIQNIIECFNKIRTKFDNNDYIDLTKPADQLNETQLENNNPKCENNKEQKFYGKDQIQKKENQIFTLPNNNQMQKINSKKRPAEKDLGDLHPVSKKLQINSTKYSLVISENELNSNRSDQDEENDKYQNSQPYIPTQQIKNEKVQKYYQQKLISGSQQAGQSQIRPQLKQQNHNKLTNQSQKLQKNFKIKQNSQQDNDFDQNSQQVSTAQNDDSQNSQDHIDHNNSFKQNNQIKGRHQTKLEKKIGLRKILFSKQASQQKESNVLTKDKKEQKIQQQFQTHISDLSLNTMQKIDNNQTNSTNYMNEEKVKIQNIKDANDINQEKQQQDPQQQSGQQEKTVQNMFITFKSPNIQNLPDLFSNQQLKNEQLQLQETEQLQKKETQQEISVQNQKQEQTNIQINSESKLVGEELLQKDDNYYLISKASSILQKLGENQNKNLDILEIKVNNQELQYNQQNTIKNVGNISNQETNMQIQEVPANSINLFSNLINNEKKQPELIEDIKIQSLQQPIQENFNPFSMHQERNTPVKSTGGSLCLNNIINEEETDFNQFYNPIQSNQTQQNPFNQQYTQNNIFFQQQQPPQQQQQQQQPQQLFNIPLNTPIQNQNFNSQLFNQNQNQQQFSGFNHIQNNNFQLQNQNNLFSTNLNQIPQNQQTLFQAQSTQSNNLLASNLTIPPQVFQVNNAQNFACNQNNSNNGQSSQSQQQKSETVPKSGGLFSNLMTNSNQFSFNQNKNESSQQINLSQNFNSGTNSQYNSQQSLFQTGLQNDLPQMPKNISANTSFQNPFLINESPQKNSQNQNGLFSINSSLQNNNNDAFQSPVKQSQPEKNKKHSRKQRIN